MGVQVTYDSDSRLVLSGLSCDCPCEHTQPSQDIYVGKNLIQNIPGYIARRGLGTRCVLVADDNTYPVAGWDVERVLTSAGIDVIRCVIHREGEVMPDETSCGEVLLSIQPETQFLVSVGSGSITDITRVNAMRCGLPFVCIGTAPSMDGYTSVVAPLLLRGVKIHRAGVCPEIIVCDLDVLATAPDEMIASGVGDVLGKYIADADWRLGNLINDEPYCPTCGQIVMDAVGRLMDNAQAIRDRTEEGMRILIEALLLSGVTILVIGNTRAVASIEHNIAQFWEMKQLQRGKHPPQHGSSVGVATLLVWPLFQRFAGEDLSRLDLDDIKRRRISREDRVRWMVHAYGEEGGEAIMRENPGDFLTWEEQTRRIRRAQERFADIQQIIASLPPLSRIEEAMRILHSHMTPEEEGIDSDLLGLSMRCGKDYRTRYTLLKLIDECGLLESYVEAYPYDWS
ncbi:sn-glycerol-1-phosphate dehydrogenase [Eubacteriales bacterium OttesenSCG-928-A19]|nr:sn-glycerol-1-phosphate dehydrogenase [Eubacteriales bacterium OttesenSCG-928-A19]